MSWHEKNILVLLAIILYSPAVKTLHSVGSDASRFSPSSRWSGVRISCHRFAVLRPEREKNKKKELFHDYNNIRK